jgi:cytochrome c oxidase subunit 2
MTSPVTPIAHGVRNNALFVSILLSPFLLLPQLLLLYAIFKFRKAPGRKPATFHENVRLEVAWTVIPAITLVFMAVPSYTLIRKIETMPPADVNVEVYGHQFFWRYKYSDYGVEISNQPLVVPVGKTVVNHMTSVDVNHAWWVPAFGVKMDTIPGRISQVWYNVSETGWYKGQCAELCGALHARMLIDVWVVTQEEFDAWIAQKQAEAASFGDEEEAPEAPAVDAAATTALELNPIATGKALLPAA